MSEEQNKDILSLRHKLMQIQRDLKAPKGQFNSFGKYPYRSCEDILEAVKPLCHKHNTLVTLADEVVLIGPWMYVRAEAAILDCDGEGTELVVSAFARETETRKGMDASQITGSASSYARKYALNGLFCIDDAKDADTQERPPEQAQRPTPPTPPARPVQAPPAADPPSTSPAQEMPPYKQQAIPMSDGLRKAYHATGSELYGDKWDEERKRISQHYGVDSSKDLAAEIVHRLIEGMKTKMGNGGNAG